MWDSIIFICLVSIIFVLFLRQKKLTKKVDILNYENNKHTKMLNVTLEAVVFFSEKKIVDLNDAAVKLFGYEKREDLIGKSYNSFVSLSDLSIVTKKIAQGYVGKYEATLMKKNGKKFPTIIQINRFEENDMNTTIVNVLDLTDIKRREHILSQNIKMAQMGEMIGNIAHQWRQPLSVITTAASGIKMKKEYATISDNELFTLLDSIVLNSEHLSSTIDVFRNFIKEKVEVKEVIIQDRIKNALSIIETRIKNNHITLINNIENKEPIKASIILGELSQVIINIINNSIDVLEKIKEKEKIITVDLDVNNETIFIMIEDNGGGISEETFPHIFEPYFTTKHKSVGTGIGLYMSYDIIVNHMKGDLYVKNTSTGAKFFIELPIDKRKKDRRAVERRLHNRRLQDITQE